MGNCRNESLGHVDLAHYTAVKDSPTKGSFLPYGFQIFDDVAEVDAILGSMNGDPADARHRSELGFARAMLDATARRRSDLHLLLVQTPSPAVAKKIGESKGGFMRITSKHTKGF